MRNSLSGAYAPAARAPPNCDSAVLPTLVPSLIAPRPPRGTHWRKRGGDHDARKWFSADEKNMRLFPHWGLIIDIPLKKTGKPAHAISVIHEGITHNVMRDQDFAPPVFYSSVMSTTCNQRNGCTAYILPDIRAHFA